MLTKMYAWFRGFKSDEGATALEYGVLVTFIIVALAAGVTIFGEALGAFFAGLFPGILS
jgi:Flp pilus assembly pilin Flp